MNLVVDETMEIVSATEKNSIGTVVLRGNSGKFFFLFCFVFLPIILNKNYNNVKIYMKFHLLTIQFFFFFFIIYLFFFFIFFFFFF